MTKIVKLRRPPTEEDRWRAIIKQAEGKLQEAIKLLKANKYSTAYSVAAAERYLRQGIAGLAEIRKSKPKKRQTMTREEWLRRREKGAVNLHTEFLEDIEHGLISEAAFEWIVLGRRHDNGKNPGFLWPGQIPQLADAVQRGVISAACYERILAANEGKFVGKVEYPPTRQRPN
jgi:hypothetical protein